MALRRGRSRAADGDPLVMLVTSSGGHLSHLLELRPFWEDQRRVWVTFELPDAVSRLSGEEVVWAHHPTTRNLPNLARNLVLAWRELRTRRPALIVSTGAGVAVPFFWLGKLFGARAAYLEVYDRIDSATMTGRLVRRATDAMLVQWPEQRSLYRDAQVMGTIWPDSPVAAAAPDASGGTAGTELDDHPDGEAASDHDARALVVVTVGTDKHRFDRLVGWAARWADDRRADARVVIQFGTADDPGGVAARSEALDSSELLGLFAEADAVVCAAGPGTVMDALRAGVKPVVVPRRSELDEHVDGHQVAFAKVLGERGITLTADTEDELRARLDAAVDRPGWYAVSPLEAGATPGAANVGRALRDLLP